MAACFLGNHFFTEDLRRWDAIVVLLPAATLFYLAGTFGNDWADAAWDARHKPHRAVPAGRVRRTSLGILALLCLAGALALSRALPGPSFAIGLVLAAVIVLYTAFHKIGPWAVLFMGLARALIPFLAFAACGLGARDFVPLYQAHPALTTLLLLAHPAGLFLWTIGLSLAARREAEEGHQIGPAPLICVGLAALLPLAIPLAFAELLAPSHGPDLRAFLIRLLWTSLPAVLLVGGWIAYAWHLHQRLRIFVPRMLAGFCLIDVVAVVPFSGAMAVVLLGLFLLAWGLQRVAPAT